MSTTTTTTPPTGPSLLHTTLTTPAQTPPPPATHPPHHLSLAQTTHHNLQHQHHWTHLRTHTHSPLSGAPLPRPLLSGIPPRRLYTHPDEQVALLKAGVAEPAPQREWVLPTQLREKWTLRAMGAVFDGVGVVPPASEDDEEEEGQEWRKTKRVLLAVVEDDSTVVYYLVHDGLVKPRQN